MGYDPTPSPSQGVALPIELQTQSRGWESNPQHPAYKAGALPIELPRHSLRPLS